MTQLVTSLQQQGKNLLDLETKRLLIDPDFTAWWNDLFLMRHFSILDFEDAEEFGFQSKWAALCEQTDGNEAHIMKMKIASLHPDLLH